MVRGRRDGFVGRGASFSRQRHIWTAACEPSAAQMLVADFGTRFQMRAEATSADDAVDDLPFETRVSHCAHRRIHKLFGKSIASTRPVSAPSTQERGPCKTQVSLRPLPPHQPHSYRSKVAGEGGVRSLPR